MKKFTIGQFATIKTACEVMNALHKTTNFEWEKTDIQPVGSAYELTVDIPEDTYVNGVMVSECQKYILPKFATYRNVLRAAYTFQLTKPLGTDQIDELYEIKHKLIEMYPQYDVANRIKYVCSNNIAHLVMVVSEPTEICRVETFEYKGILIHLPMKNVESKKSKTISKLH